MKTSVESVQLSECVSQRAASQMTGLTTYQLMRLVAAGKLRTVSLPGVSIKYVRKDVVELAEKKTAAAK